MVSITRRSFLAQGSKAVLATGIGGSLLAACGGSNSSSSGPVTLKFGWWSNTPAKDNAMKAWVQSFVKSHPNIQITTEILPWSNYWDKLKTTTAGGNAYDIVGIASSQAASYYNEGALVDLSTFSDLQSTLNGLTSSTISLSQWNGKTYGVPVGTSVSVLGYNKKILDAAGVPAPDPTKPMTFDQFKAMAAKIYKPGQQFALNPLDCYTYDTFVRMNGGQVYDNPVNPSKITINSPEGIQGLTDYNSLFTLNISPSYAQLTNGPYSYDLGALETGKIAFARAGAWLFADMAKNPDYGICPLFYTNKQAVIGTINSLSVYKGSKNQAAAWEFLKWAAQTPQQIDFAKFSDIPANQQAINQLDSYITPQSYAPTLQAALPTFVPDLMTTKDTLSTTFGDIITNMTAGKLTPAQAAAQMEQQGNSILASA